MAGAVPTVSHASFQILHAIRFCNRPSLVTYGSPGQAIGLGRPAHGPGNIGLASWWARREDRNMSEKSPKELQTMIEELTKRSRCWSSNTSRTSRSG
jgi:hypothetical protein